MAKEESVSASTRVSPEVKRLLDAEAERRGQNVSDFLRRMIVETLSGSATDELRQEIQELRSELLKVRGDLATLAQVLLVKVAKEDPDKALAWIRKNLGPQSQ